MRNDVRHRLVLRSVLDHRRAGELRIHHALRLLYAVVVYQHVRPDLAVVVSHLLSDDFLFVVNAGWHGLLNHEVGDFVATIFVLGFGVLGLHHWSHGRRIDGLPLDILTVNCVLGVLLLVLALHRVLQVLLVEHHLPLPKLRLLLLHWLTLRDNGFLIQSRCLLKRLLRTGLRCTVEALDDLILLVAHLLLRTGSQSLLALILFQIHFGWTLIDVIVVHGALRRLSQLKCRLVVIIPAADNEHFAIPGEYGVLMIRRVRPRGMKRWTRVMCTLHCLSKQIGIHDMLDHPCIHCLLSRQPVVFVGPLRLFMLQHIAEITIGLLLGTRALLQTLVMLLRLRLNLAQGVVSPLRILPSSITLIQIIEQLLPFDLNIV